MKQSADTLTHRRNVAQQILVNTAITHAVHALYAEAKARRWAVDTTIGDHSLGSNEAQVIAHLCAIPKESDRVRTFSLLAKKNAFNLSIKSAGAKTESSINRKSNIPGITGPLTDEVRISIVSSDIELLNRLSNTLRDVLLPAKEPVALPTNIEPWFMRGNALLSQVLKTSIGQFGAEIQFLPREQARTATHITHHFLKISRVYEDTSKSFANIKDVAGYMTDLRQKAIRGDSAAQKEYEIKGSKLTLTTEMFKHYNTLASFYNRIASNSIIGASDIAQFNHMLENIDASSQTLDEVNEVGDDVQRGKTKKEPSPVFKTTADFLSYRKFISEQGAKIGLFPLPEISQATGMKDMEGAILKLRQCSQLTHACYMRDAQEPFRKLWTQQALQINEITKRTDPTLQIPQGAINWVQGDIALPQPQQQSERARHGR